MMSRRQMLMMLTEEQGLPSEYLQVEYLESTGTQYIDTGLLYQASDVIDIDTAVMDGNSDHCVFGAYSNGAYADLGILKSSGSYYFRYDVTPQDTWAQVSLNTKYHVQKNGASWYLDGELSNEGKNYSTTHSLYLFGRFYNGGANKLSKVRIYSYKHSRNNVELINLVPCIRISDSKPGMYDAVSKTFFTNDGTGEFSVGVQGWDHVYLFNNNAGGELLDVTTGQTMSIEWDCPNGNLNGWVLNGNGNTSKDLTQLRAVGMSGTDSISVTGTGQVRVGAYSTSGSFSVQKGIIKVKLT